MTFFEDAYIYEIVGWEDDIFGYRFKSEGEHVITKVVSISPIGGVENTYNLGFGNQEKREDGTVFSNDKSTQNNNDFDRVLKTVFKCVIHYLLEVNPTARVLFSGNAEHKHRTYLGKVGSYIDDLSEFLIIEGGALQGDVPLIEEEYIIQKRGKEIKRKVKVKDQQAIDLLVQNAIVEFLEPFNIDNTKNYQFVSIQLK